MGMIYRIAASNSAAADQQKADVVCTGSHDERIINEYIAKLVNGGTLQFLDGDYFIDAFDHEGNSAIFFGFGHINAPFRDFSTLYHIAVYISRKYIAFSELIHITHGIYQNKFAKNGRCIQTRNLLL
jgi:hypothetical protein